MSVTSEGKQSHVIGSNMELLLPGGSQVGGKGEEKTGEHGPYCCQLCSKQSLPSANNASRWGTLQKQATGETRCRD